MRIVAGIVGLRDSAPHGLLSGRVDGRDARRREERLVQTNHWLEFTADVDGERRSALDDMNGAWNGLQRRRSKPDDRRARAGGSS